MRRLVWTLCLLASFTAGGTEVYRWVDGDGVVHFSDRPEEGAERVELQQVQTFTAPPVRPVARGGDSSAGTDDSQFRYQELEFVEPGQEEVLWNIGGQLDVSMRLQPRLQPGHQISLYLDDQPVRDHRSSSLTAQVKNVPRGTHVLRAEVRDPEGKVLIRSQPRTFSVQQTSVLNPNNPNNPVNPSLPVAPVPRNPR